MPEHQIMHSDRLVAAAKEIAMIAAGTAMNYFRKTLDVELKGDHSPVTIADRQVEREVRDYLAANFSDHSILGEEYGSGDLSNEHVWVVDPIDGTRSFISGHPLFGFLLAYVRHEQVQMSMVSMPALGELFLGQPGKGATLNGASIQTSATTRLAEAILYINEGDKLFKHESAVHARLAEAGHTRRFAYDCYPHALLAAGHVDAVVDYDLKPFDFLPLLGVVEAAGGVMSDWDGNALTFHSGGKIVSAATPELHRELLDLLAAGRSA